jgi:hypothetical protein
MPDTPRVLKATFVFETRTYGWTESFLWQNPDLNLTLAMPAIQIIAQKRAALMGQQSSMKAQRISVESDDAGNPRVGDSYLLYNLLNGVQGEDSADEDLAVLVTMRNLIAQKRRNMFLRGIPDGVEDKGGQIDFGFSDWLSRLQSWTAAMLAKGVGWWSADKDGGHAVTGYVFDAATGWTKVNVAAGSFVAPFGRLFEARFVGVNGQSALNGRHLVRSIDATSCWVEKQLALANWVFGGTMFLYARHFEQAVTLNAQKIVTRRAGAPLLQSRGRRKAQVRS